VLEVVPGIFSVSRCLIDFRIEFNIKRSAVKST